MFKSTGASATKQKSLKTIQEIKLLNAINSDDNKGVLNVLNDETFISIELNAPKDIITAALDNENIHDHIIKQLLRHPGLLNSCNLEHPRLAKLSQTFAAASNTEKKVRTRPDYYAVNRFAVQLDVPVTLRGQQGNQIFERLVLPNEESYGHKKYPTIYETNAELLGGDYILLHQYSTSRALKGDFLNQMRCIKATHVLFVDGQTEPRDINQLAQEAITRIKQAISAKFPTKDHDYYVKTDKIFPGIKHTNYAPYCMFVGNFTKEQQQQVTNIITQRIKADGLNCELQFSPTLDAAVVTTKCYLRHFLYRLASAIPDALRPYNSRDARHVGLLLADFKQIEQTQELRMLRSKEGHHLQNIRLHNILIEQTNQTLQLSDITQPDNQQLFKFYCTVTVKLLRFYILNRSELGSSTQGLSYITCNILVKNTLDLLITLQSQLPELPNDLVDELANAILALYETEQLSVIEIEKFDNVLTKYDLLITNDETVTGYIQTAYKAHPLQQQLQELCKSRIKLDDNYRLFYLNDYLSEKSVDDIYALTTREVLDLLFSQKSPEQQNHKSVTATPQTSSALFNRKIEDDDEVTNEEYELAIAYGKALNPYTK